MNQSTLKTLRTQEDTLLDLEYIQHLISVCRLALLSQGLLEADSVTHVLMDAENRLFQLTEQQRTALAAAEETVGEIA